MKDLQLKSDMRDHMDTLISTNASDSEVKELQVKYFSYFNEVLEAS